MKALVAASQCPHCGHLFELRDSFGELLPLAHCTACNSWYPSRRGSCRWCGTKPEGFRIAPYAWKGVGILAFVGMGVGVWLTRDGDPEVEFPAVGATGETTGASPPPLEPVVPEPPVTLATIPEVAEPESVQVERVTEPPTAPFTPTVTIPPPRAVVSRAPSVRRAPVRRARPQQWTSSVARSWVTLRSAPDRGARIVGSVGPDTRIQLGESRGNWRRIRTRGVAGWAEQTRVASRETATR